MEFDQKFTEADLLELEKVFSKTMEVENSKILLWRKPWIKTCLYILAGILFICSVALYFLEGTFSNSIKLYFIIAVIALCWPFILDILRKRKDMLPARMVRSKYAEPIKFSFKEDSLVYRKEEFLYTSVSIVVEYKKYLFIRANKKWLVIKASEEEKDFILGKVEKYPNVCFVTKEEAFSLKELTALEKPLD